jgi:hypothetical protein
MGRWTWWLIGIGVAYFLFYLGGNYSFRYTHVCTHSHREVIYSETQHASTSIVCDRYSGNARKWSFGDPVRAVPSERFIKWDGMAIGGFVVVIGAAMFLERRRRKNRPLDSGVMHATPKT